MKNTTLLNGKIQSGTAFDNWFTIKLVQGSGYKIDLLFRINEIVDSFGKSLSVRYWITDKPTSFQDAQDGFIKTLFGAATADLEANSYSYSEYTQGCDYDADITIGGHNLLNELMGRQGEYLWIEVSADSVK